MSVRTDVNRTIDEALGAFGYAVGTIEVAIEGGNGRDAIDTLRQLEVAFIRMAGLARLSDTPFDHPDDAS